MTKNYIIKKGDSYLINGDKTHGAYTFDKDSAARFTEFGACLKTVQMPDETELEVVKIK